MKSILSGLYYDAKRNLDSMKKSEMSLKDRIAYEKAIVQLETMKLIIDRSNIATP